MTDRLEAERRLQAQLERYRQIADAVPGMTVWIIDREIRCRFAAGAGFSSIAVDPASFVDRPLAEVLSRERFFAVRPHLMAAFAGRTSTEEDPSLSGHHFWLRYLPITGTSGEVEEVLVVGLEVTDREQAYEALRRSEASFSSAFENSPIGMAITAPDGSVLRVNDAFCALTQALARRTAPGSVGRADPSRRPRVTPRADPPDARGREANGDGREALRTARPLRRARADEHHARPRRSRAGRFISSPRCST